MQKYDYIITGMGASGLLLAYHLSKDHFFANKTILLLDKAPKIHNDRTWCFWEAGAGLWDEIVAQKWPNIAFGTQDPLDQFVIDPYAYKMIRGKDFYDLVIPQLEQTAQIDILYEELVEIKEHETRVEVRTNKSSYHGKKLFNSVAMDNGFTNHKKYPLLNQHFIGWFVKTEQPVFDPETATFMDFSVEQKGNTRFMYVLPTSTTEALLEYTLFSEDLLDDQEYEEEIIKYLQKLGVEQYEITEKERGCIPMTCYPFWESNTTNILQIGTAGGWTKASTGFTFNNSMKKVRRLIQFLKTNEDLSKFEKRSKFWYYDLLFLDVLYTNNHLGAKLFGQMFKRNTPQKILKFLDEETTLAEDLKITTSLPWIPFLKALWKRILP